MGDKGGEGTQGAMHIMTPPLGDLPVSERGRATYSVCGGGNRAICGVMVEFLHLFSEKKKATTLADHIVERGSLLHQSHA